MPKGRKTGARERNAEESVALESVQEPELLPREPSRPRTRAWVKQEEETKRKDLTVGLNSTNPRNTEGRRGRSAVVASKNPLPAPQDEQVENYTGKQLRGRKNKGTAATEVLPLIQQVERKPSSSRRTRAAAIPAIQQRDESSPPQRRATAAWLSQVEPVSSEEINRGQDLDGAQMPTDTMESSSASRESKENESTAKGRGSRSVKISMMKLRYRRVNTSPGPIPDEKLPYLRSILKTTLPERALNDIEELRSIARKFLEQIVDNPHDSCYSYIDDFSFDFDKGKSEIHYPIVNRRYFESDLRRCLARNEAVLQRTIMIHIINQYWLGTMFDWNSEGQWSQPKDTRLPSREDDDISLPKPDLTISFTLKSFTNEEDPSDPIPEDLEKCISPDGGDRCFPFLFFEVKKAGADLAEAYMTNLHNAGQALYNIYNWMVRAGLEEEFFENVRVFSLVFNAQDLSVRVHRAVKLLSAGGALSFQFDEFLPLARYTKDQACLLIQTILTDYAAKELHTALKDAFTEIASQETERVAAVIEKRKANTTRSSSSKRARRDQNSEQHTGQSFGMSNLGT